MVNDMHSDMQDVGVSYATRQSQINWSCCIIWQTDTDEPLQCPSNCKWCGAGAGYQPFAEILPKFQAADALPLHVDPADWWRWGQWYVQRYLCTMLCGTNHADCFSIPRTPNSLCQKVLDSVWSWKTFPLHCCSWSGCSFIGADKAKSTCCLPCLCRMWYNVILCRTVQKVCLGNTGS